jgi:hypothetical protein
MGDAFDGEFMFDPFLSGHVIFVNPKLQAAVDKEIEEVRNRQLEAVLKSARESKVFCVLPKDCALSN